jgi:hypothetical protein
MTVGKAIVAQTNKGWFELQDIIDAMLADIVSTDANFQLTQAQAWRDFADSINEYNQVPAAFREDLVEGLGRLENLGIQELSVKLPLERYSPGFLRRLWWSIKALFGFSKQENVQLYRLSKQGKKGVIELTVMACRQQSGKWEVSSG